MPDENYRLSGKRLMEIGSLEIPQATHDEWIAILRLARIGQWYDEVFRCRFRGDVPGPHDALLGSRLRIQIDMPHGDWVDWRRDGRYE